MWVKFLVKASTINRRRRGTLSIRQLIITPITFIYGTLGSYQSSISLPCFGAFDYRTIITATICKHQSHNFHKLLLFLIRSRFTQSIGISPIQRPHYITSSYTYQFFEKNIFCIVLRVKDC